MVNSPLEFLARQYGNVVLYDKDGNPSIFVKFPKMKSRDLDPSLPDHTHPAFIVNGVEKDYILIAKYKASTLDGTTTGTLYSLPNAVPVHDRGADELLAQMRAFGGGVSGKTVADSGFLLLLAQKMGWDPHGNSDWGHYFGDAARYELAKAYSVGNKVGFRGWLYECITAHTSAAELIPEEAPGYWKRIKQIGGVEAIPTSRDSNVNARTTLTGTGPRDWNLGDDPSGIADIIGNLFDQDYGYRIVDGEIQILENNNAADPTANLAANSGAWKAILPNKADTNYTLVAPGTTGTLHWTWANGKITLDTVVPTFDDQSRGTNFKDLAVNTTNVPFVPHIMRELGLFPTEGSTTKGYYYVKFSKGEFFPRRGGGAVSGSDVGLGYVNSNHARGLAFWYYGARARSL